MINKDTREDAGYRADTNDHWPLEKRKNSDTNKTIVA
jgi:hypothetical protein